jgi:hypothetical protein
MMNDFESKVKKLRIGRHYLAFEGTVVKVIAKMSKGFKTVVVGGEFAGLNLEFASTAKLIPVKEQAAH